MARRRTHDVVALNPEPSEFALAVFARHKANGTTPGNPKWYHSPVVRPFNFKPGQPPKYPHLETGADWFREHHSTPAPDPFHKAYGAESTAEYVARYNEARGFA